MNDFPVRVDADAFLLDGALAGTKSFASELKVKWLLASGLKGGGLLLPLLLAEDDMESRLHGRLSRCMRRLLREGLLEFGS
jgi:hypothetical protein